MKDVIKAFVIALLIVVLGEVVLAWQYHRLEKKRIPLIEEKLEKQQQEMEQGSAQDILDRFILARVEKNEAQANLYLTEQAMEQKLKEQFTLINDFTSYEILKSEKLTDDKFRFIVKIYEKDEIGYTIEAIILTKILNQYYIESVEIAG